MRPVVAVLAVIRRGEKVLLVRRANPPDAGKWGYPGGKVEFGETLAQAAEREAFEETGVRCVAGQGFAALDAFHREDGHLLAQYAMVAVRCDWVEGEPVAGDDALDAAWVPVPSLANRDDLSADVGWLAELVQSFPVRRS